MKKMGVKGSLIKTVINGLESQAFMDIDKQASSDIKKTIVKLEKYIIQIGRIEPVKNYETTIKALAKVPYPVKFVIVGPLQDKHYKNMLDSLIKKLKLEKRVVFLGVIRGSDKYYLIKHAQMMVHMARWESGCNVIHEAMSQGLTCIVADNAGLTYQIKNGLNGYRLPADDFQALAEKVNYVLKNKNSRIIRSISRNNAESVFGYTWKKVADELAKFYQSTLVPVTFAP